MNDLRDADLFSDLTDEEFSKIEHIAQTRTYSKNTIVIEEGDESNSLFVIKSGRVKVSLPDKKGREFIITMLGPGQCVGEMSLVDQDSRSARVTTSDETQFYVLPQAPFSKLLDDYPTLHNNLLKQLCKKLRASNQQIRSLALMDVYGRVANVLVRLAEPDSSGRQVTNITQQELADRVGASREMVNRILKDLATGGYISLKRGHITLNERLPERW